MSGVQSGVRSFCEGYRGGSSDPEGPVRIRIETEVQFRVG